MIKDISLNIFKNAELLPILITCLLVASGIFFLFKFTNKKLKSDLFAIVMITSMYAIVSLWQLGSSTIPVTWWQPQEENESITFEVVSENSSFDTIYAIGGEGDNNALDSGYQVWFKDLQIFGSNDNQNWDLIATLNNSSSYMGWVVTKGDWNYRYLSVVTQDVTSVVNEIAFKSTGLDELLVLQPIVNSNPDNPYNALQIIDEQDIVPLDPTYYDSSYFDEIYHPRNAWEIANGQDMYASVHPLLGTSIMAVGIKLFGMNPFGWRIMGALFGIMILPLFYLLTKKLFNKWFLSVVATTLFATDFMLITTSRIGTLEPFSIFFILLMTYFMVEYFQTSFTKTPLRTQLLWLALSGISMGLAVSTKWTGCYGAIALAIIFFCHFFINLHKYNKVKHLTDADSIEFTTQFKKRAYKIILWCCLFFVIVPSAIYVISFIPTRVWKNDTWSITNVVKHSFGMYNYHANLQATHPYQSVWYQWLFDIRPIWYYFHNDNNGIIQTISCFNNPLLSITGVFSMIFTMIHSFKTKSYTGFIIVVCYLAALLPWVLVSRVIFSYHYYPAFPFLILSIIYVCNTLLEKDKNNKKVIIRFVLLAFALFILFMPVLTGFTTTQSYAKFLQWLPSWVFGG